MRNWWLFQSLILIKSLDLEYKYATLTILNRTSNLTRLNNVIFKYQPLLSNSSLPISPTSPSLPPTSTSPSPRIKPYTSIPDVIRRTYAHEGLLGFYKGIGTNAVRILPGTCVTFVVYEQVSRLLGRWGETRGKSREGENS